MGIAAYMPHIRNETRDTLCYILAEKNCACIKNKFSIILKPFMPATLHKHDVYTP